MTRTPKNKLEASILTAEVFAAEQEVKRQEAQWESRIRGLKRAVETVKFDNEDRLAEINDEIALLALSPQAHNADAVIASAEYKVKLEEKKANIETQNEKALTKAQAQLDLVVAAYADLTAPFEVVA